MSRRAIISNPIEASTTRCGPMATSCASTLNVPGRPWPGITFTPTCPPRACSPTWRTRTFGVGSSRHRRRSTRRFHPIPDVLTCGTNWLRCQRRSSHDKARPSCRRIAAKWSACCARAHHVVLGSRRVEAVNSAVLRSIVGHELAKRAAFGEPWGLVYRLHSRRVDVSLYSIGGLDVSRIAKEYGGGGHRNAAGFSVSLEKWLADFV